MSTPSFLLDLILPETVRLSSILFSGKGLSAFPSILIFSFIKTGLSEEIFFRGFLGKRISNNLGFTMGNSIQALVFGCLHGVTLFNIVGVPISIVVILFTGLIGWLMGYINEKQSGGSIIPSWCLHGIANTLSGLFDDFCLIN